ncbi:MAG: lytic transglycosylase domain-containing protein [Bacillota bacterium]|nr:lytic transglycosylase domain-containing protein [Bacillota bacterium]
MIRFLKKLCVLIFTGVLLAAFAYCVVLPRVLPLKYQPLIEHYAECYGLEITLVNAVIFCESRFEPDAVSSAGALGLMQITPETGRWAAKQMGFDADSIDLLMPEENIRIGCWYLSWLLEKFDGITETALAGYNAGQGNVEKWLADTEMSKDGITLEEIPYEETKGYVRKVQLAEKLYRYLYHLPFERIGMI